VFKALLFLGSGSAIHGVHDNQDMRKMGGLRGHMRTTWWTYVIGALALAGIFPFAGFWSKDEIIAAAFDQGAGAAGILLILTSILTAFYMGRQVALTFYGRPRSSEAEHAHESGPMMLWPLIILAIGSVVAGVMNLPGLHWLETYLEPVLNEHAGEFTLGKGILAAVVTILAAGAGYVGWYLYAHTWESRIKPGREDPLFRYMGDIWRGMEIAWGFDWFYNRVIVRGYRAVSGFLSGVFDAQGIDGILVDGPARLFGRLGQLFREGQTGYIRNYAWVFAIGVVVLVGYFAIF
jgi:NADH-quinone oxidoreductase subunit L